MAELESEAKPSDSGVHALNLCMTLLFPMDHRAWEDQRGLLVVAGVAL